MGFELDTENLVFGELIASRGTTFDVNVTEILLKDKLFQLLLWLQRHLDNFSLAIAIGREPCHL